MIVNVGLLLALVGGFLDGYNFISRDGVFANAQTGNLVLLAINLSYGSWKNSVAYILPIIAFISGVLVAETVKHPRLKELLYSYRRSILILECIVLIIVGGLPSSVPNLVVTVCISFVSSLQISTFTHLDKWTYNSTMTTGNIRIASQAAYTAFINHDKEAKTKFKKFFVIIISFSFGAFFGSISTKYIGNQSVWIAAGVLLIALILYHKDKGYFRKKLHLCKK
ncbi:YoaK family protein [Gottfriedia acidiceleris]|uniref:YoaK family protein n=1 Tax=Gottfriedia acidiceleris TaxID=371036 RepID=UPI001F364869|nr:YoaK family protein [Gottfriedia acidiceleris]